MIVQPNMVEAWYNEVSKVRNLLPYVEISPDRNLAFSLQKHSQTTGFYGRREIVRSCGNIPVVADPEPKVQPKDSNTEQAMQQDLKALSGGERSFSTVCFVLALWDTMECPFRIMDEFDIFMVSWCTYIFLFFFFYNLHWPMGGDLGGAGEACLVLPIVPWYGTVPWQLAESFRNVQVIEVATLNQNLTVPS